MKSADRNSRAALALACALTLSVAPVRAGEAPEGAATEARGLFEHGVKLAGEERWAEAEQAFSESEALVPRASTAYDRALSLYRLGRLREMLAELDRFMSWSDPTRDADDRASAERLRQNAEAALGTLTVTVIPVDTVIEVDREVIHGTLERSLRLDPGEHLLSLYRQGFVGERRTVRLAAAEHVQVAVALQAVPPPPETPPPPSREPPGTRERKTRPPSRSYAVPITLAVLGGVSLAGAAVTGIIAGNLNGQISARCRGADCPAELSDDQSRMWALAMTSDGLLIAGSGLLGASLTVWLLTPATAGGRTATVSFSPSVARFGGTF
ncbi:MAG TPA: hypothetical protein VF395_13200 [Polyangiaceae bacterium]